MKRTASKIRERIRNLVDEHFCYFVVVNYRKHHKKGLHSHAFFFRAAWALCQATEAQERGRSEYLLYFFPYIISFFLLRNIISSQSNILLFMVSVYYASSRRVPLPPHHNASCTIWMEDTEYEHGRWHRCFLRLQTMCRFLPASCASARIMVNVAR
jgi:hypothetical protein